MRFVLALLLAATVASAGTDDPYPRFWYYSGNDQQGPPLLTAQLQPPTAPLDLRCIQNLARHPLVCLGFSPWGNLRGVRPLEATRRLRGFNPRIKILGYFNMNYIVHPPTDTFDPADSSFSRDFHWTMRYFEEKGIPSVWIYDQSGNAVYNHGGNGLIISANWGHHAFMDSLGNMFVRVATMRDSLGQRLFDGFFFDSLFPSPGQSNNGSNGGPWDLARMGYASNAEMDTAHAREFRLMVNKIRAAAGPSFLILANTDPAGAIVNGVPIVGLLKEGFPSASSFATVYSWLLESGNPTYRLVKREWTGGVPFTDTNRRREARYILGTTCLGDGWSNFYTGDGNFGYGFYDEYSVDPYGRADTSGTYTGWLGRASGAPVLLRPGVYRRNFSRGAVIVNSSGSTVTVKLHGHYKHILGVTETTINDGQWVSEVSVPSVDAVFLIGRKGKYDDSETP